MVDVEALVDDVVNRAASDDAEALPLVGFLQSLVAANTAVVMWCSSEWHDLPVVDTWSGLRECLLEAVMLMLVKLVIQTLVLLVLMTRLPMWTSRK